MDTPRLVAQRDNLPRLYLAIAETPGIDSASFATAHARVTHLLGAPDSLVGLPMVLRSLSGSTLPRVRRLLPNLAADLVPIRHWVKCLRMIEPGHKFWDTPGFKGRAVYESKGDDDEAGTKRMRRPGVGAVGSNPLWVSLGYASETPLQAPAGKVRNRAFRNVQIALLAACLVRSTKGNLDHKRLDDACRLVRRFGGDEHHHELEQYADRCKVEEVYQQAAAHHRSEKYPIGPFAGALADFLSDSCGLGHPNVIGTSSAGTCSPRRRHHSEGETLGVVYPGYRSYDLLAYGLFDPEANGHPVAFGRNEPDPEAIGKLIAAGIDPYELSSSDVTWVRRDDLTESSSKPGKTPLNALPPLQTVYGRGRSRAQAQRLAAQRFTTRRDRITVPELARILSALDDAQAALAPVSSASSATDRLVHEALLLAGIAFATGTHPEGVRELHRWPGNPSSLPSNWQLAYEPGNGPANGPAWRRPCLFPDRGPQYNAIKNVLARNMTSVSLSDAWGIGPRLEALERGTGECFQHSLAQLDRAFKKLVRPKLADAGVADRWNSLRSLADVLPSWLLGLEEGDQLKVALLFARHDSLAKVHLFYTAFDPSVLDDWHFKQIARLRGRLGNCGYATRPDGLFSNASKAAIARVIAGDERILAPKLLKDTTTKLRTEARCCPAKTLLDLVRRHNLVTGYVGAFLAICTGFRSVRTPIPDLTLIDDDSGFLVLQEKDRRDNSHGRIVWIPPRLQEQVDSYLRYLRTLWFELPPSVSKILVVPATKQRDRSQFGSDRFELDLGRTLFFLEASPTGITQQEFTGTRLKHVVESVVPGGWPFDNSARHFLRSILMHRGCPATSINTLMGHAGLGEGAWAPQSGLDPFRYRESLQPFLDGLLDDLHFEVLRL